MDSKKVVNDVLNHKQPKYIPLGTYAIDCDIAGRVLGHETYVRNKVKIQIALWEGRRAEVVQSLKEDSVELFKKLDCIDIIIPMKEAGLLPSKDYVPPKMKRLDENTWQDDQGNIYQHSYASNDIAMVFNTNKPVIEDFEKEPIYDIPDSSIFEAHDYLIDNMKDTRFIAGIPGGFKALPMIGGFENGLMAYYLNPDLIKAYYKYNQKLYVFLDRYYINKNIDQIFIEEDYGTTIAPFVSPKIFSEFCLPIMKERIKELKKYCDKVMIHSCGNTWELMDMIIEGGVDCYQSLQTGAGMDIRLLKEKYGDKMCFWGGVSVEKLIAGTMDDVREDVRYAMKYGTPDGGFILGPSHSIAYGTKYDNFMAMLDEYIKLK